MGKNYLNYYLTLHRVINLKWIVDQNVKSTMIKFWEENGEEYLFNFQEDKYLLAVNKSIDMLKDMIIWTSLKILKITNDG